MTLEDPLQASYSSSDLQYYLKTQENQLAYATQNCTNPNTASVFSNNFCCTSPAEDPQLIPPANPILFYINDMLMAEKMDHLQDLATAASVDGTSCTSDLSWKDLHFERAVNDDWPVDDLLKELPLPDNGYLSQSRASNTPGFQVRQHPTLFPAQVSDGTSLNCGELESWQIVATDEDADFFNLGAAVPSMAAASPLPEVRSPQLVNLWNGITNESDFTTQTQCEREPPVWISTSVWQVDAPNMADAPQNSKIDESLNKVSKEMTSSQPCILPMVNITDCQLASAVPKAIMSCVSENTQGVADAGTDKRAITEKFTQSDMKHHVDTQTDCADVDGGHVNKQRLVTHASADSRNSISNMKLWGADSSPNSVDPVNMIRQHDTVSHKVQITNAVPEQNTEFDQMKGKIPTITGKGQIDVKPTVTVQENKTVDVTSHTSGSAKKKASTQAESDASAKAEARAAIRRRRKMLAEKQKRKHMQAHMGAYGNAMVCRRPDPLAATMITTMVDVRGLLVSCAEAVATNHTERAKEMLREIWRYASPTGSGTQRLAYYFGQGLESRMKGTGGEILQQQLLRSSAGVKDLDEAERMMRAYQTYVAVCPFLKLSYFYANEAILRMLLGADQGSDDGKKLDDIDGAGKVVHIVDLNIMYGLQWPCFLKAVGERGKGKIKKVRITGVGVMSSYGCCRGYDQSGYLGGSSIGSGMNMSSYYVNNQSRINSCSYGGGLELMGGYIGSPSYNPGVGVISSYNVYGTGSSKVGNSFGGLMYMNSGSKDGGAAAAARFKIHEMKKQLAEAGKRMEEYARAYGVELEYKSVIAENWEGVTREALGVEADEAETLVVNCIYRLRHLRDELEMQEGIPAGLNPREAVLARLRSLNPKLFVEGVVNGAYNAPFFMSRFKEALFHFSSMFDALDATVRQDLEERMVIEREIMGREILNVVACEGAERLERPDTYRRWQLRTQRVGFQPLPLDPLIKGAAQAIAHAFYHKDYGVENDENGHWLLLGWKGRMLHGISSWRPATTH